MEVKEVKAIINFVPKLMKVVYPLRERNKMEDFFANIILNFASVSYISFNNFQHVPNVGKVIINMYKMYIPYLHIKSIKIRNFL